MVSAEDRPRVRINVSDFGPIAEAGVELRPLTVFVGPSNTGKTYFATLIYALHRFFSGATFRAEFSAETGITQPFVSFIPFMFWGIPKTNETDMERELDLTMNWMNQLGDGSISDVGFYNLPSEVAAIVRGQMRPNPAWGTSLASELSRCFGVTNTAWLMNRHASSDIKIALKSMKDIGEGQSASIGFDFGMNSNRVTSSSHVSDSMSLRVDRELAARLKIQLGAVGAVPIDNRESSLFELVVGQMASSAGLALVKPLSQPAHFLPTDRTGILHAHRWVIASTASAAPIASLKPGPSSPSLSGTVADFIVQMMSMGFTESRWALTPEEDVDEANDDLGDAIENQVLSGQIRMDESNPTYPTFLYLPHGWDRPLPLMNASSMVSELAPVVLYLRHVVKPGETLIIEEPESNLHPAMQVEFMRQLAAVVNAGVRIMITTHSEWILDELANLVRLSELPPEKRTPRLKDEPALDPRDVGVWLFERGEDDDGSHVKELPLDLNQGGFESGYEDTARLTYNQWAAIHNLLQK